jgi:hypothetical protein
LPSTGVPFRTLDGGRRGRFGAAATRCVASCALAFCISASTHAAAADPLRCWWRSTPNAVRIGERFTIVLTCRLVETPEEAVIVDRSGLDPIAIQLPPFELLGGRSATDVRTDTARFFQYEYFLRLIDDRRFKQDVALPPVMLKYRIRIQTAGVDPIQGIERTYTLPPHAVHILSLVSDQATDIRDASTLTFRQAERASSRAEVLVVSGVGLVLIGCVFGLFAITRFMAQRNQPPGYETVRPLPYGAVLRAVSLELEAVGHERRQTGWTPALQGRALVALRILSGLAVGLGVNQRYIAEARREEGALLVRRRLRASALLVSSSMTPQAMARSLVGTPAPAVGSRDHQRQQQMLSALIAFTRVHYGRETSGLSDDETALDGSLEAGAEVVRSLRTEHRFHLERLRKLIHRRSDRRMQQ